MSPESGIGKHEEKKSYNKCISADSQITVVPCVVYKGDNNNMLEMGKKYNCNCKQECILHLSGVSICPVVSVDIFMRVSLTVRCRQIKDEYLRTLLCSKFFSCQNLKREAASGKNRIFSEIEVGGVMEIKPLTLGAEVTGVDLKNHVSEEIVKRLKEEVHKHRLLIFKNQGEITGDRHVEISKWFGELESTFYKHPRSPHPDVFRVSNVEEEGCRNVGRTGWHIDGSFMEKPFNFSLYYMHSVPENGDTAFVPLKELIESLSQEKRDRWERLYMLSDRRSMLVHPLIYPHPVTKQPTLCFHLGMIEAFIWDYGTENQRVTQWPETSKILQEIHEEIVKDDRRLIYSHKWEVGDFIISDNLALGHEATPETQYPRSKVGLRILHRTTIQGTNIPTKDKMNR